MCQSRADGGRRCAAHSRAAYERALRSGDADRITESATAYAATESGRAHFVAAMHAALDEGRFEDAAAHTVTIAAGDTRREVDQEVADRLTGPPVLGVDLDGTVAMGYNEAVHAELIRVGAIDPETPCDPRTYDLAAAYGLDREVVQKAIHAVSGAGTTYRHAIPDADGIAAINALYDEGCIIKVTTARSITHGGAATMEWLTQTSGLKFHEVAFAHDKTTVSYDLLIDDAPYNVVNLQAHGRAAALIDRPWNRDVDLPRIADWDGLPRALSDAAARR